MQIREKTIFNSYRRLFPLATLGAALAAFIGCGGSTNNPGAGNSPTTPNFSRMVVVGDSLSAGFQNGSLLDTQQPNGWASLVAAQAKVPLALPLIAPPGLPAVLQLVSIGPPAVVQQEPGVSSGRDNSNMQPFDLAVPGHKLNDLINAAPTALPTTDEDIITSLILGLPLGNSRSQMNEAIALDPTVIFVWIGDNDALAADESGTPSSMTDVTTFTQQFQQLLSTLRSETHATLIVANIPDVTLVPYLTPAATVIAEVAAATGLLPTQAAADLGIVSGDLVNATGMTQAEGAITAIKQGQTPTPLTDAGFLNAAEIAQVQTTVSAYNSAIAAAIASEGATAVDLNAFIQGLALNGMTINGYNATTTFLGGLFGLDGLHPTNTGYALIANQFIDTMNISLKTAIPDVDVSTVAAADPLFGPNIKPIGASVSIPLAAAQRADRLIAGHASSAK